MEWRTDKIAALENILQACLEDVEANCTFHIGKLWYVAAKAYFEPTPPIRRGMLDSKPPKGQELIPSEPPVGE